jgi:lysyl-tRNA synthetase class 2
MMWKSQMGWKQAKLRADILSKVRGFFIELGLIEVETPLLSQATVTDLHLDAFTSRYDFLVDAPGSQAVYLQTSPEFAMKRLLASGYGSIFQICKAFRHESYGSHHNPEFTMLEWYRLDFDHFDLINEVESLLVLVLGCDQASKISYQQVFLDHVKLDPLECSAQQLLDLIKTHDKLSDWLLHERDVDILLQFVFSEIIEPNIGKDAPCFVYDFPCSQASLAKISPQDTRVAQRFECYFRGIELANGFNELTDPNEQFARFQQDNVKRKCNNLPERVIDKNFIQALEHGLPQCAGVALGIDRLVMLALNESTIERVLTFPIEQA